MRYINLPTAMQVAGVAILAVTVWKGVHGFVPTAGLLSGAALAYFGKHFSAFYKVRDLF